MLPTTWFYLSALMIFAIFFRFNRFWSVRNLDLLGLILLTPGLIFLAMFDDHSGYIWIFGVHLAILVRLMFDTVMVRRPLLEPNLTPEGLTFACVALFAFMIANVAINRGERVDSSRTIRLEQILSLAGETHQKALSEAEQKYPGYAPFYAFADRTSQVLGPSPALLPQLEMRKINAENKLKKRETTSQESDEGASVPPPIPPPIVPLLPPSQLLKPSAIDGEKPSISEPAHANAPMPISDMVVLATVLASHLMIVLGLIYIGHAHFGNIRVGIASATIYLLHPYTNQMLGRIDHFLPAALLVWAVVFYRRPFWAGTLIGVVAALVFYPIFLLPLWCGFYLKRGWIRFLCGTAVVYFVFIFLIFFFSTNSGSTTSQLANLFGRGCLLLDRCDGVWEIWQPFYRIPVIALFFAFSFGMSIWPTHKHLATLVGCSTIIMLGSQFWQSYQGGLFMAWYLPLLILTIFRPNLEDRTAVSTVVETRHWF